ncbi:YigZ family protein [Canibacter sp. lx-45]|uniref:YigZ family protein n=1 Tax=Canibacter zhuwentaonis TaxID=2837491 RepID=UPI001BDD88B5|nr:YigZ family protein [Canibacter zhuwentaonis]MBT1035902.1 YigZ family protein [Canibacter zhuwentaonis]
MTTYKTIARPVSHEIEISRSRFITRLERISSDSAARQVISAIKSEHPKAHHHCTAFIIGAAGEIAKHNDDGEPAGTAGAPMYETLAKAGVSDTVAVVTRYFGGVLLGAAGLTRAYRAAVAETLQRSEFITRTQMRRAQLECGYEFHAKIMVHARQSGIHPGEAHYTDRVSQEFWVPPPGTEVFKNAVSEITSGQSEIVLHELTFIDLPG